jgi:hypothetical protein
MQSLFTIQPHRWLAATLLIALLFVQLIVMPFCHASAIVTQAAQAEGASNIGAMCIVHGDNIDVYDATSKEQGGANHTDGKTLSHCDACVSGGPHSLLDTQSLLHTWAEQKSHEQPFSSKRHTFSISLTRPPGQAPPVV